MSEPTPSADPGTDAPEHLDHTDEPLVLRFSTPEELLAAVPFLWGFHPRDSLVVIGLREADTRQRSCFAARIDVPPDGDVEVEDDDYQTLAEQISRGLASRQAEIAVLVAYSSDVTRAERAVRLTRQVIERHGIEIHDALRADGERWWSYFCANPACCPPEGTPYDLTSNRVTADAVFAGRTAYADREDVRELVRPLLGATRESMLQATDRAEDVLTRLWTEAIESDLSADGMESAREVVVARGGTIVRDVVERWLQSPWRLTDDEAATLSVFLSMIAIRDAAWLTIRHETAHRQVTLWRQVTQRAVPPYDVAPASLLAFAAWLAGECVLARFAIERALAVDPDYGLARIVDEALCAGVSPDVWDPDDLAS